MICDEPIDFHIYFFDGVVHAPRSIPLLYYIEYFSTHENVFLAVLNCTL